MYDRRLTGLAAIAVAGGLVTSAHAGLVTVDPDDVPGGVLTNAFAGLTLTTRDEEFPGINARDVLSATDPFATTGSYVFAQNDGNTTWGNGTFEFLHVEFDTATDFVSLDFASNDSGGDSNAQLLAFDEFENLVDIDEAAFVPADEFVTLSVSGAGIKFVAAYWDNVNRTENGVLDHLVYSTPSPGAAMMLVVAGLAGGRRRRD